LEAGVWVRHLTMTTSGRRSILGWSFRRSTGDDIRDL
jgi:hypothetical protein